MRLIVLLMFGLSILYAEYSLSKFDLDTKKTIYYEKELTIEILDRGYKISSSLDADWLGIDGLPSKLQTISFEEEFIETIEDKDGSKQEITSVRKISFNQYNFLYLLVNSPTEDRFALSTKIGKFIVETDVDTKVSLRTRFGKKELTGYSYKIVNAIDENTKIPTKKILTVYKTNSGELYGIELINKGVRKVVSATNSYLLQFEKELATRVFEVKKFDFSKDTLYLTYFSNYKNSQKRMNISYSIEKKFIKSIAKFPVSFIDPENSSSSIEESVAFYKDSYENGLFQLKHVKLIDGVQNVSWLNRPDNNFVNIDYISAGAKENKVLSKSIGQQFYSFDGLFYLASWTYTNKIDKVIITLINGTEPIDLTFKKKKNNLYSLQKSGKTIWDFTLDELGYVSMINYPEYNIEVVLEDVQNDETIKNKQFIEEFQKKHSIIKVD